MKKTILFITVVMILVIFAQNCKTEFVWDPTGDWTWTITASWPLTWSETITFTGTESGGSIIGWDYFWGVTNGIWSKTGDYTITITYDRISATGEDHDIMELSGTSSESSPNSMTCTGTWIYYWNGSLWDTWTINITGTKTTNLQ